MNLSSVEIDDILRKAVSYGTGTFIKEISNVSYKDAEIPDNILKLVPQKMAIMYRMCPVTFDDGVLKAVTDSSYTRSNVVTLQNELNVKLKFESVSEAEVNVLLNKYYDAGNYSIRNVSSTDFDSSPLKRKINDILQRAAREGAADVHILPHSGGVYVQFRINGAIVDYSAEYNFAADEGNMIVNIIKGMDTSGNAQMTNPNMPGRGSFGIVYGNIPIDCRLSTVPVGSIVGNEVGRQKANIREIPQKKSLTTLNMVYQGEDLQQIKNALNRMASGLVIMAGPVGSGKTNSLYAMVNYIYDRNGPLIVYAIENPIEIKDERFVQVQVREASQKELAVTAQDLLKLALRSDMDMGIYGEIRDAGDAMVAVTASQTGHPIFTTIHAADCVRSIRRLMDLNIPLMSLLSEIKLIVCQRLVSKLCPDCSVPHELTDEELNILTDEEINYLKSGNVRERGHSLCTHCANGVTGRMALPEYVAFNDDIRDAIMHMKSFREIREMLFKHGYKSMWQKGLEMVHDGKIELRELLRKVGKDE